ncbi:MAG: peptidyl-prolyl cis-trans isomerase [Alphaproteobacteria bacterium]|nr:peptidyl-prolyl cis-trans isomerase [Alphaproteobacteria bacterium]
MLQIMRELAKSWIFKSLMGLLVVSFGIWGIGDMFRTNPAQRTVATVGSQKIPVHALEFRFQAELPQARKNFGPDLTADQARRLGLLDNVLSVMMEELAFDQDATQLGIEVPHAYIMKRLAEDPSLRTKDGAFNAELWHHVLGKSGMTEQTFLSLETKGAARQLLLAGLTANAEPPKTIVDNLYRARGDKRILEVVTLNNDSQKSALSTPKTDEIEAYYKANESKFIAPEYRGITIGALTTQDISKDVRIDDAELKQAYETRAAELADPETRDLVQIVVQDEAKAKTIAKQAQDEHNLATAAKKSGLTPITMDKIDEKNILPELYTTVFALTEGQVCEPVKSALGWHVIQVKKIHDGGTPSFEEAKTKLAERLREERVGDLVAKTVNQLDDDLAGGKPLEDISEQLGLHLTRFAALDNKGITPDEKPAEALPAKEVTLPSAFSLESGETGQVLDDGKGTYYVVRVDQVTPSQVRPLDDVKKEVVKAWEKDQLEIKAAAAAEAMAQKMRDGQKATSFASQPGVEVRLSKPVSLLGDMDKNIPVNALRQLLTMKKGDVTTASNEGKQYILRLSDIVPVDPAKPEASRRKVLDDIEEKMPRDLIEAYSNYLHTVFPFTTNQSLFDSLKNRGQ